jgi:hypothetical protein
MTAKTDGQRPLSRVELKLSLDFFFADIYENMKLP